jgi:hypothetical protein
MALAKKSDLVKVCIILSPIPVSILVEHKIPVDTGNDNFMNPLGVFLGIPFIAIVGVC